MINDLSWREQFPDNDLVLIYSFLGNFYKVKLDKKEYSNDLDYIVIKYQKIFHIITNEENGFSTFVSKEKRLKIEIGYFTENKSNAKKEEKAKKILPKQISIEDEDIIEKQDLGKDNFEVIASVELSLQGLKYGPDFRNKMNGVLFKNEGNKCIGNINCIIRIQSVKDIDDLSKYSVTPYPPVSPDSPDPPTPPSFYILPIHFVVSNVLSNEWIELVEKQKIREEALVGIRKVFKTLKIKFDKKTHKEKIFLALESLISKYSTEKINS